MGRGRHRCKLSPDAKPCKDGALDPIKPSYFKIPVPSQSLGNGTAGGQDYPVVSATLHTSDSVQHCPPASQPELRTKL